MSYLLKYGIGYRNAYAQFYPRKPVALVVQILGIYIDLCTKTWLDKLLCMLYYQFYIAKAKSYNN